MIKAGRQSTTINATGDWQHIEWKKGKDVDFSKDFLVTVKQIEQKT
jgi:hypothetical protein